MRNHVVLRGGEVVRGHYPGTAAITLTEHQLRDELARDLGGATEATLPFGRADVLSSTHVFEVEPRPNWRHAVRQVLAYAAQCDKRPAIALFGAATPNDVLTTFLKLRDNRPPIALWWYDGSWTEITNRRSCRAMKAVALVDKQSTRGPVAPDTAAQLLVVSRRLEADKVERNRLILEAHTAGASLREIEKVAGISYGGVLKIIRAAAK